MKIPFMQALRVLCISMPALSFVAAQAVQPGPFSGSYHLDNVVEDSTGAHLTVTLTLLNSGKSDIHGGIVALLDGEPHPAVLASFAPIKLLAHASQTKLVQTFTVPSMELARWENGHPPVLQFLVPGADGAVAANIQAVRVLMPGEAK